MTEPLAWDCEVCAEPIADSAGHVCVSYRELHERTRLAREWDEQHAGTFAVSIGEFLTYPATVSWRVLHARCDPEPDSDDYWIGVERIRTPGDVISWTAHLLGKRWLQVTNWDDLLRTVATRLGGAL